MIYSACSRDWRGSGSDAGCDDPRVRLELGTTTAEQLVACNEYHETDAHVEDVIAWLAATDTPTGTIYCDHEPAHVDTVRQAGDTARTATKDLDAGITAVCKRRHPNGNLPVDDSSNRLPVAVDGDAPGEQVGLLVSAGCEQLVREFRGDTEAHVGRTSAEDHCLDARRDAYLGVAGQ